MSFQITLSLLCNIVEATSKPLLNDDRQATGISTDTRTLKPGDIFVALRGENFDGHNFIDTALAQGAIAVITERPLDTDKAAIQVKDTLAAYQKLAHWWRHQFSIPTIAITGSVGKTTTKELIATVLSTQGKVLKTQANYNNEIGVPKTLLELAPHHDYAVIEMAMRAKGEIALLSQIARPTLGVITNVGTAHIGRLGSQAAIAQAKCELLAEMPDSSVAVLNGDDVRLIKTAATVWQGKTVTYGLESGDITGELINPHTLKVDGVELPLPLPGRHNALNTLAAITVAKVLQLDIVPALTQGIKVDLPGGRARRHQLPNDIVFLDETYNAGMESMVAALHLLKETPGKRHLAVLGTMKELGEHSAPLHHQVGETVKQLHLDGLFVLINEPETEEIAAGASGIPSHCFTNHEELFHLLQQLMQPGDRILFKASNSVGLNHVVARLLAANANKK